VPELPEVESARAVIGRAALEREIVDVDDSDTYECRPHSPGEIRAALLGRRLTAVHRRGKSMWLDTSDTGDSGTPGPALGIHLGMSGKIVIADGNGHEVDGGDYWDRGRADGDYRFSRFSLTFADGASLLLIDPRRLGRVRLDPPVEALGPDARAITPAQFRAAFAKGTAPVKARLLNQDAIAGIGNLRSGAQSSRRSPTEVCTRCRSSLSAKRALPARGAELRWRTAKSAAGRPGGALASKPDRGTQPNRGIRPKHLLHPGLAAANRSASWGN
jgi:hypothetical protein